jgi:hypothetical protein
VHTVVEQPLVSRAIDDAKERWPRAHDAWDTISWILARDPQGSGIPLTESGAARSFTLDGARSIGLPTVTVLYEIRFFEIIVHDALFEDAKFAQAGRA